MLRITPSTTAAHVVVKLLPHLSINHNNTPSSLASSPTSTSPSDYSPSYWLALHNSLTNQSRYFDPDELLWSCRTQHDVTYHLTKVDIASKTPWDTLTARLLQLERDNAALRQTVTRLQDEEDNQYPATFNHPATTPLRNDSGGGKVVHHQSKTKLVVPLTHWQKGSQISQRGGSNAIVYTAFVDGWSCAVKEVCIEHSSDAEAVMNEINILERMPAHPNVVRYVESTRACINRLPPSFTL
jgi:hypothetical protein